MIESLLCEYHNFGNKEKISKIMESLRPVKSLPVSNLYTIGIPQRTIELLHYLEITKEQKGRIKLIKDASVQEMPRLIFQQLFVKLLEDRQLHNFFNERSVYQDSGKIFIKNNQIPIKFSAMRNLLIDFDLFLKDGLIENQFYVHPDYQKWFCRDVVAYIEECQLADNPLSKFIEIQVQKEEAGKKAEEFVLLYELQQRKKHPNAKNIRIISDQDVGAGYDIASYMSDESLLLDKFIEVKSYQGTPSFYWSENEVKIAKEKRYRYYLYVVDRSAMADTNYQPIQIKNPAQTLFSHDEWIYKNDGYFFEAKTKK